MASAPSPIAPPDVRWDLSALFSGMSDPKIAATHAVMDARAEAFATKYRGKINPLSLTASELAAAIVELEAIYQEAYKPLLYANLLFAGDSLSAEIGAFMQEQQLKLSSLRIKLMFFSLELMKVPAEQMQPLVSDNALANYRHYIATVRENQPFTLSEKEEVIFEECANTGGRAWVRYSEEILAKQVYHYIAPDADVAETLSEEEVLAHLRDPNREVRIAAAEAFTRGLKEIEHSLVFCYNTLLLEKSVSDRLRSYDSPEHERHINNELTKEIVDQVVDQSSANYGLVERYYNAKKVILGLDELTHVDRYAPIFDSTLEMSFDDARTLILDAFADFSVTLRDRADEFFVKNWIDAEPRTGKSSGAFCSYLTPDTHPVVFMTYLNKDKHVGTLAHELGHGVHASLSRDQSFFNFHGTLPLAELASIFAEMLVFERMLQGASTRDKVAMYADKIEGIFASVFRQVAMFRFERRAHAARRTEGELTADNLGDIWQEEIQAMFGNSVKLGEEHRGWWSYVWHFVGAPFYVYAYAFGELLTLALYEKAKQEGPGFAAKYEQVLRLGGSKTPQELMSILDVDLTDPSFWAGGLKVVERFIDEYEGLVAQL